VFVKIYLLKYIYIFIPLIKKITYRINFDQSDDVSDLIKYVT